jgi:NDP-sugar pyrophosphorylase family protein
MLTCMWCVCVRACVCVCGLSYGAVPACRTQSIVGQSTHIGPGSKVKQCVVGNNVRIGQKANIIRSVIMDGAVVGDNCTLQDTVLGHSASVSR